MFQGIIRLQQLHAVAPHEGAHWDRAAATGTQLATGQDALIQLPPATPMPGLLRTPQSEVNRSRTQPGCGILKSFPGGKRKKMK